MNAKITIELEMDEKSFSTKYLQEFLSRLLSSTQEITIENDKNNNNISTNEHLQILEKFSRILSAKQKQVFKYFVNNPGTVFGDDLRNALEFLKPHGSLSGVFRCTMTWKRIGGANELCPFTQVYWSKERSCGCYRGLNSNEVEYFKNKNWEGLYELQKEYCD